MQFPAIEDLFLTAGKVASAPETVEEQIEQSLLTAGLITGVALAKKEAGVLTPEDDSNLRKIVDVCTKTAAFAKLARLGASGKNPQDSYIAMISDLQGQAIKSKVAYAKDMNLPLFDSIIDSIDDNFRNKVASDLEGLNKDHSALIAEIQPFINKKLAEEGEQPGEAKAEREDDDSDEDEKKEKKENPFTKKKKPPFPNQQGGGAPEQEAAPGGMPPQAAGGQNNEALRAKLMAMLGLAGPEETGAPAEGEEAPEGMEEGMPPEMAAEEGQFADEGAGPEVTPEALLAALQLLHPSEEQPAEGIDINQLLASLGGNDNNIEDVIRMLGMQQGGGGMGQGGLAQRLAPLVMAGQQMQ